MFKNTSDGNPIQRKLNPLKPREDPQFDLETIDLSRMNINY